MFGSNRSTGLAALHCQTSPREYEGWSLQLVGSDRVPQAFGALCTALCRARRGVGAALPDYAVKDLGARRLDVDEQNAQAVGFYLHYGFEVVSRSEIDGMGDPFPAASSAAGSQMP